MAMSDEDATEWKSIVQNEYFDLVNWRAIKEADSIKSAWQKNREAVDRIMMRKGEHKDCSVVWNPPQNLSNLVVRKKAVVIDNKFKLQEKPIKFIQAVPPIPNYYTWVATPCNIMVPEEKVLFNLPYLGDHIQSQDVGKFLDKLKSEYSGGVHGNNSLGTLDDSLMVELLDSLKRKGRSGGTRTRMGIQLCPVEAFEAVAELFPEKGDANEITDKYIKLKQKTDPNLPLQCLPNIDGPNAISASRNQVLKSFHSLFCRRCFKYDCLLHRNGNGRPGPNLQKRTSPELEPFANPCGSNCYMLLDGFKPNLSKRPGGTPGKSGVEGTGKVQNEESLHSNCAGKMSPTKSHSDASSPKSTDNNEEWTGSDECLFRSLHRVFQKNYCAIANIMLTKTCQQVYMFAQQEGTEEFSENLSPKRRSLRKRVNKRQETILKLPHQGNSSAQEQVLFNYTPCSHPGQSCDEASDCNCVKVTRFCEKFCFCRSDCPYRFPGCSCKTQCNTSQCPCYLHARECDPDLCKACGANQCEVDKIICKNVSIQRGLRKHLLIGCSDITGWGAFLKDGAQKYDFISEYCGEIISQEEADRRGIVYDVIKCSYLFNLNSEFVIDATRKGNKTRFFNHSDRPNCYAKVMLVNGDHRIGIYAKNNILPGEELLFNYRYITEFKAIRSENV